MLIAAIQQWFGANTKLNAKVLPAGIGVHALNLWTEDGDFRGVRAASAVHALVGVVAQPASIYRMGRDAPSDSAYWLTNVNDLDYARSMLASDPAERTYYTGDGVPKVTDNTFLGAPPYPTGFRTLGVPAPASAMTAAVAVVGTGDDEDRVYLDTFVTDKAEESAPNPNTTSITLKGGSTADLSVLAPVPGGQHGITLRRIYVSVGGQEFKRVAEIAASATNYTDTGTRGAVLASGGKASSPAWLEPPATLIGLTELWNGMLGGFTGKAYRACVAFKPWAWPIEYEKTVPDTIVGSATWGQNWLLVTSGMPRLVIGSSPASLSDQPVFFHQAGVSKRSVVGVGHGVCWASNDGLCYHGQLGTKVLTEAIMSRAQWRAIVPSTIIGAAWGRYYLGFFNDGTRRGFMLDTIEPRGIVWLEQGAHAVFSDTVSQALYLLDGVTTIRKWDSGALLQATFKSGVVRHAYETCPGAAAVAATTYPLTFTLWANVRTSPADASVMAWQQIHTQAVTGPEPFRLPGGYLARDFQVQIQGAGPAEAVMLAEEVADIV